MKYCLLILLVFTLNSCSKTDEPGPNQLRKNFAVSSQPTEDGKSVKLSWSPAKDISVRYTIILKDTLVKNLASNTFTIRGLDYNFSENVKIIATNSLGLSVESSLKVQTKIVEFIEIPDARFEQALINQKIDKDSKIDGKMDIKSTEGVTTLYLTNYGISSLKGIDFFKDLTALQCDYNKLREIDLSKNTKLNFLRCDKNEISELDISLNSALVALYCSANNMKTLKTDTLNKLMFLQCQNNLLTEINTSQLPGLKYLHCYNNLLYTIDLSKNADLLEFVGLYNKFTNLDITRNTKLQNLVLNYNFLKSIDVSKNTDLSYLHVMNNRLTSLDVSKNPNLKNLSCMENKLTKICVADVQKAKASFTSIDEGVEFVKCN